MDKQHDISVGYGCRGRGVFGHDKPLIPEHMRPQTPRLRHRGGFTLVELLVIVGIITLLIGILLPSLEKFMAAGEKAKTRATIGLIDGACQQYFTDFEDYPPSQDSGDYNGWTGSELIVLFLTGYMDDPNGNGQPDGGFDNDDGEDGFGFRLKHRGRVYGPYNGAENLDTRIDIRPEFLDTFGTCHPILYYRYSGSNYSSSHNNNGPGNLGNYTRDNGGVYYRTDFILISKGVNERWDEPRVGGSDDVTNFFNK